MILAWLIIVPAVGGLLGWGLGRRNQIWSRWLAIVALTVELILGLVLWAAHSDGLKPAGGDHWWAQLNLPWIPQLGIHFHLALDGLSFLMVLLTAFLGLLAVIASWREIHERVGFFHLNLMLVLAGILGVFLAMDLFLFYFFWELMLVPMYFLIVIWGGPERRYVGIKFFIFTQLSGLLLLLAILGLYFIHGRSTGQYTFEYTSLLHTSVPPAAAMWLLLGFLAAFLVKLPAVPLHSWLPDAYASAPTAGSVILAGLMSKTAAYGLLRFAVPLFPQAAATFAPVAMVLAIIGIWYGAALAFAQNDLKRLVAYSSISHLGFVLLGIFAWNQLALQGVVMQMICHGVSVAGLFVLAGVLEERLQTRDMRRMGGLWPQVPRMGAVAMFLALASVGLPGLGNFIGEFLILLGTFQAHVAFAAVATTGFVAAIIYALWMIQLIFHGPKSGERPPADLKVREVAVFGAMILVLLWLGFYPRPELLTAGPALETLRTDATSATSGQPATLNGEAVSIAGSGVHAAWPRPQPTDKTIGGHP